MNYTKHINVILAQPKRGGPTGGLYNFFCSYVCPDIHTCMYVSALISFILHTSRVFLSMGEVKILSLDQPTAVY